LGLRLAERLEANREGGRLFALDLFRVDGAVKRVEVAASRPLRDEGVLTRLFAERLSAPGEGDLDAGFGFDLVRLSALAVEPLLPEALPLEGTCRPESDLAALGDRIGARLGPEAVQRLAPAESHVPERAVLARPLGSAGSSGWPGKAPLYADGLLRPLRLFARPEVIEAVAEVPEGPPKQFRWRRVARQLVSAEGPERVSPEWWRAPAGAPALTRDYYRVEDDVGYRYWIFREGLYGREIPQARWFIHGVFA